MKTVEKLATEKTSLPITNIVQVTETTVTATNLDVWAHWPNKAGLAPGLYHGRGLTKLPTPANVPESDYPTPGELGDLLGTITLSGDDLAALPFIAEAMSKEHVRYYLCGICFDGKNIVATDGARLHMLTLSEGAAPANTEPGAYGSRNGFIVPAETIRYVLAALKETKAESLQIAFYRMRVVFYIGQAVIRSKYVDGTFPDYPRVIPQKNAESFTGTFDGTEFKPMLPIVKTMAKIAGKKLPVLRFNEGKCYAEYPDMPIRYFECSYKPERFTAFDLNLLAAIPLKGELYQNDMGVNFNAVVVTEGNKLAVLMTLNREKL